MNDQLDGPVVTTGLSLSPRQRARLAEYAKSQDRSMSYIVRLAVDQFLERLEQTQSKGE